MNGSVYFDDKSSFATKEINNKAINRLLAAKTKSQ